MVHNLRSLETYDSLQLPKNKHIVYESRPSACLFIVVFLRLVVKLKRRKTTPVHCFF